MFASPLGSRFRTLLGCALFVLTPYALHAHELEESAVTPVVRDGGAPERRVLCTWSRLLTEAPRAPGSANERLPALMRSLIQI